MTDPMFSDQVGLKFGNVVNGRYYLPPLSGDKPLRIMRMTNLVGAFEDTRALSVWEQAMTLAGLALAPELYEELTLLISAAVRDGADLPKMRDHPELREALAGQVWWEESPDDGKSIAAKAKAAARADAAARAGTARHAAWEERGRTGALFGTPAMREHTLRVEELLKEAGLERIGLSERVVYNTDFEVAGRFDEILREKSTSRLLIADLKTQASFYSYTSVDAQLAGYASAKWMLSEFGKWEPGPQGYVDQSEGVIMHMPSDGSPGQLLRADLMHGREVLATCTEVIRLRAYGRSAGRKKLAAWSS